MFAGRSFPCLIESSIHWIAYVFSGYVAVTSTSGTNAHTSAPTLSTTLPPYFCVREREREHASWNARVSRGGLERARKDESATRADLDGGDVFGAAGEARQVEEDRTAVRVQKPKR